MKVNVAIYGGAFDPFTNAHLQIAKTLSYMSTIDEVYIEPANQSYKNIVASRKDRTKMIELALRQLEKDTRSRIYFGFYDAFANSYRQPYTYETLEFYSKVKRFKKIHFVIGSDQLKNFNSWKNPELLAKKYKWIVFERGLDDTNNIISHNPILKGNWKNFIINPFSLNVSSSVIRDKIKNGKSYNNMVQDNVSEYIHENKLYV